MTPPDLAAVERENEALRVEVRAALRKCGRLRGALKGLCDWGAQIPLTDDAKALHRERGYRAFDKARAALKRAP